MSWNDVWKIILAAITSVGGVSAIIIFSVKFASNIIAKRLEEKYSKKLERELEKYKSELEKQNYVSKVRFDREFKLYQELCSEYSEMVNSVNELVPCEEVFPFKTQKEEKEFEVKWAKQLSQNNKSVRKILNSNIPFIKKEIYRSFNEILQLSEQQLEAFLSRFDINTGNWIEGKEEISIEDRERTNGLNDKYQKTCEKIYDYLRTIDVLEDK